MFSIICRDELTQHFVSLGWDICIYRPELKQTIGVWFKKDGLRTNIFKPESTTDLETHNIVIYNMLTDNLPKLVFYEIPPQWLVEGGRTDVGDELVKWIKEVEAKWHLHKL